MNNIAEGFYVIGTIDPDANTTGTLTVDVIDMMHWEQVMFVVMAGDLGSSATLDFAVLGDVASGGSFATALTGKAITQLTQAGSDSDKQAIVRVSADEVAAQSLRYIRGLLTTGTATSDSAVIALGKPRHYAPATGRDLSTVDEVIL